MAGTRGSDLAALTTLADGDLFLPIDVSDTSMASSGTNKKITAANVADYISNEILPFDAVSPSGDTTGVTDLAAIQAALTAAAVALGSEGRTAYVVLKAGTYFVNGQLIVPDRVWLAGGGRNISLIQTATGFPTNTAIIRLGAVTDVEVFGCGVSGMAIIDYITSGSIGVYSNSVNEKSGVRNCLIKVQDQGIRFAAEGGGSPKNCFIEDVECTPASSSPDAGSIGIYCSAAQANIRRVTVFANLTTPTIAAGLVIDWSGVVAESIHVEGCVDGVIVGSTQAAHGVVLTGISGPGSNASVTNLVRLGDTFVQNIHIAGLSKGAATNVLVDDTFTVTYTNSYMGVYWVGDGAEANRPRFSSAGPRPVITASHYDIPGLDAVLAALQTLGFVTDSSVSQAADHNVIVGETALDSVTGSPTTGVNDIGIGYQTFTGLTTGNFNTGIGHQAGANPNGVAANESTTADNQTLIGCQTGQGSTTAREGITCVGFRAIADGTRATAVGRAAVAGHDNSVALGDASSTTAALQVKLGGRHIELVEVTEPAAGAANSARLYAKDNGSGKTQLCVRFATGAVAVLATEP